MTGVPPFKKTVAVLLHCDVEISYNILYDEIVHQFLFSIGTLPMLKILHALNLIAGSITIWLVSSLTSLDSAASLHIKHNIFSSSWSTLLLLNWRPAVQWSFPQGWVFSGSSSRLLFIFYKNCNNALIFYNLQKCIIVSIGKMINL